jgi:uncharacterized membrane protein
MLPLSLVIIAVGVILLFFVTYAGVIVGIVGILLFLAFLLGAGRAAADEPHQF